MIIGDLARTKPGQPRMKELINWQDADCPDRFVICELLKIQSDNNMSMYTETRAAKLRRTDLTQGSLNRHRIEKSTCSTLTLRRRRKAVRCLTIYLNEL